MLDFNTIGPNDIDNQFVVETPTVKITGYKTEPYSLWKVRFSAGSVPRALAGSWTSRYLCAEAVARYVEERRKAVLAVKETTKDFEEAPAKKAV